MDAGSCGVGKWVFLSSLFEVSELGRSLFLCALIVRIKKLKLHPQLFSVLCHVFFKFSTTKKDGGATFFCEGVKRLAFSCG